MYESTSTKFFKPTLYFSIINYYDLSLNARFILCAVVQLLQYYDQVYYARMKQ